MKNDQASDYAQLKRMAIFAKVVELNSFAKAAESLSMSPSGVSEQVSALEAFLDTRLLHRTTRKLSLTLDGESVLANAMKIVESYEHIRAVVNQDEMAGSIRLTTTHDFAMYWLSPRLAKFQKQYPKITFDLVISDQKVDLIEEQIDLAIRIGKEPEDSSIIARPLLQEPLRIFSSPSLFEHSALPKKFSDANRLPWILLKQLHSTGKVELVTAKNKRGDSEVIIEPATVHQTDSPIVMMHLIMSGLGVGMLLPSICSVHLDEGKLIELLPNWQSQQLNFSIMYSSRRHMPKRVQRLLEYLLDAD